jgi:CoA:oxalate CoA-transferase
MGAPLKGIRVLDLSVAAAGPYGAMLLGDLGAEIIKIETLLGDISRESAGPKHDGESFHYLALNRNKKGIVLNLRTKSGKKAFYDLIKVSDVVWDNFRPGIMERLGADHETLRKINSKIISCSITGYGREGPYRDRPSWDPIILGLSGMLSVTGEPGRPPVRPGPPVADFITSLFAVIGTMTALFDRERTGTGRRVDISMLDSMVSIMGYYITYYFCGGGVPKPLGSGHLAINPLGCYPTKEGYIALGPSWPRICRALGVDWLMDDPRFATTEARCERREELNAILTEYFIKEKAEDWLEVLYAEDIPAAPVNTIDKVVVDPQVLYNNMLLSLKHLSGEIRMVGNPIKMADIDQGQYFAAPTLGQHTNEILTKVLGYSIQDIKRLEQEDESNKEELKTHLRKLR